MAGKRAEGKSYGNGWMYRTLIGWLKHINIKLFYLFSAVFAIPISMIFSRGMRLTYRFFRTRKGWGRWSSFISTYKNHCIFAQTVIDKFAMYAGHKFKINYKGLESYKELLSSPDSFLQLSAHIGCSEIVGYSFHLEKPFNVLVYGGESAELMNYRRSSFGNMNIKMIPVGTEVSHSEDIVNALENGEILSAFADRYVNKNKTIVEKLYGEEIYLAKGPFSIAVTRGLNVVMVSALKEKDGSYTAYITPLKYDKSLSPKEQRQQLAKAYIAEIERILDIYPLQWFNYSR